jgi:creatinine amidohydrolase
MTDWFAYADLTWPEIAALPRDTPLVIPLGDGYPLDRLANALGVPPRVGLFPPIPYGWSGSGLHVDDRLLGTLIANLLDSLRDDGFSRVVALTPPGIDLSLGAARIALPPSFSSPPPLPLDSDRTRVVLIPIGHTEQHAYHLPMSTDTLIIDAIGQGVTTRVPEQAVSLPVMPYGASTHRSSFAGTLNTGGRAFEDFWLGVIDVLVTRGFDRMYLLSGHGGNCSFLVNVTKYAGERHRRIFCATAWLYLSGPDGIAALDAYRRSAIGGMGHACELETSLMLHLRPDLVHMERAGESIDPPLASQYLAFGYRPTAEEIFYRWTPADWRKATSTGYIGSPKLASEQKGRAMLEALVDNLASFVVDIQGQDGPVASMEKQSS